MSLYTENGLQAPPFARPLVPYIKTRQEALRIRQALTLYLRSQIIIAENDTSNPNLHSHVSLCVLHDAAIGVKRPPELSGLRKEYLKALQENIIARKEYNALANDVASGKAEEAMISETREDNDGNAFLQTYLARLRSDRRHEKLQVFQHYLKRLSECNVASRDMLNVDKDLNQQTGAYNFNEQIMADDQKTREASGNLDGLVFKLEKAVIIAKSQVDREKRLLEDLKARQRSSKMDGHSSALRISALQRTRDELVQWVEEKLVASGADEDPLQTLQSAIDSSQLIKERTTQIKEQYAAYTKARKSLLDAFATASQPLISETTKPPLLPMVGVVKKLSGEISQLSESHVLLYTSEVLHPLSKVQRALALQKSYLSGILAKERSTTLRVLSRLSDESHLRPEYPILARQPRFAHVTATGARSSQSYSNGDEIVSHTQAWAFASDAARGTHRDHVEQKIRFGGEMADNAHDILKEVYEMLNQDLDKVTRDEKDEKQDDPDIWAAFEARPARYRARQHQGEKRARGPWSGLNGRVGVMGDI
jgi:hypothetical protein